VRMLAVEKVRWLQTLAAVHAAAGHDHARMAANSRSHSPRAASRTLPVARAPHAESPLEHVQKRHRRRAICMPEQFLNSADVVSPLQEVRREREAHHVRADHLRDASRLCSPRTASRITDC
jgi:hypothetical protein